LALQLRDATQWSDAIKNETNPRIYSKVNRNTGALKGNVWPFNEYYLVAYLANLTSPAGSKANKYFETYMGTEGEPTGDGNAPAHRNYHGYDLLTDNAGHFMSSFIPQFNYYLAGGYQTNQFYRDMNTRWLKADKLYWSLALNETSTIWGIPVLNRTWGAGAGPCPTGYCVEKNQQQPGPHNLRCHHGRLPPQRRHGGAAGGNQQPAGVDVRE